MHDRCLFIDKCLMQPEKCKIRFHPQQSHPIKIDHSVIILHSCSINDHDQANTWPNAAMFLFMMLLRLLFFEV